LLTEYFGLYPTHLQQLLLQGLQGGFEAKVFMGRMPFNSIKEQFNNTQSQFKHVSDRELCSAQDCEAQFDAI